MSISKTTDRSDVIFWGGLELPISCGPQHFVMVGAPGSGKSINLQLMMQSVLPRIRTGANRRAIIYDAKRDIYTTLLGMGIPEDRIHIFNPFDARSVAWDMALDVDDPATAVEIATILVPERSGEVQPFFPQAARALIGGIMEVFIEIARKKWTLRDVVLALRTDARMKQILSMSQYTEHLVGHYLSGTDTHRDINATIENTMRRLAFVAAAWDNSTSSQSMEQWVQTESILLLGSNPSLDSTIQQINSAILHRLSQIILNQPEARHQTPPPLNWLFIDELRRAGRFPNLPEFMVEGRSKGLCAVLAFQDLPGLMDVYTPNLAKEIIGTPRNKAFLKLSEPETAEYACRFFGQLELEMERYSESWGTSSTHGQNPSWTSQSGGSRQRMNHTRPAIAMREFMKILEAIPENGIGGFFDTASIGDPYFTTLPGALIDERLARPHPSECNVKPRPREHQMLREWDKGDLKRLGLSKFPELLAHTEPNSNSGEPKPGKEQKPTKGANASAKGGGLLALLPKRKP